MLYSDMWPFLRGLHLIQKVVGQKMIWMLGRAGTVVPMLEAVLAVVPVENLAVHFHDTYGQALVNILAALQVP